MWVCGLCRIIVDESGINVEFLGMATDSRADVRRPCRGLRGLACAIVLLSRFARRRVRLLLGEFEGRIAWAKDPAAQPDRGLDRQRG